VKILLDENIPPRIEEELQKHDVKLVRDQNLGATDKEVVNIAEEENRTIITQDDDFGKIYYFSNPKIKIIVIEPEKQEIDKILNLTEKGLRETADEEEGLFIISDNNIRVRK
jgi:predicted nuclease of predicted toxin-antitoxin system